MLVYLFPFKEVANGSNIIIYGAGHVGTQYLKQIQSTGYCNCMFFVDKHYKEIGVLDAVPVLSPEQIKASQYDKIVIAMKESKEVRDLLRLMSIPSEKIISAVNETDLPPFIQTPDPENSRAWDYYYSEAEKDAKKQYDKFILPIISKYEDISYDNVLDFACGRGRIANIFKDYSRSITCCDVNEKAIDFCRQRFGGEEKCSFDYVSNQRADVRLEPLTFEQNSFTFIYSWDAMVHFSYKWLDYYISEFYRVAQKDAYVLIHHSNYAQDKNCKSENWYDNLSGRTSVTKSDVGFIAKKHGFHIVEQVLIDWQVPEMDCVTLLKK